MRRYVRNTSRTIWEKSVSIYKAGKQMLMHGGDKEEGMEVIGQHPRETLNLFFPTDQQLFTQHHKRYHIQMQENTQRKKKNKQPNNTTQQTN